MNLQELIKTKPHYIFLIMFALLVAGTALVSLL